MVAAESRAQHAFDRFELWRNQYTTDREPASHALGHRDEVRFDPGPLMGEELARTAISALDFVKNQRDSCVFGGHPELTHEVVIRDDYSPDTLDALDDHGSDVPFGKFIPDGLDVVHIDEGNLMPAIERSPDPGIVGDGDSP